MPGRVTRRGLAVAVLAGRAGLVRAQGATPKVSGAWARATPPHATSAVVYLTIASAGTADRLTAATTAVAATAGLHESRLVSGVMQMRPLEGIDVAPGHPVTLQPGGLHLMLTGLRAPLKVGQRFDVTLTFEKAGAVTTSVTVGPIGASAMPGMQMGPD